MKKQKKNSEAPYTWTENNLASQICDIMGGLKEDFLYIVREVPNKKVEDYIDMILDSHKFFMPEELKQQKEQQQQEVEKKVVVVEKVEEKIEKEVEKKVEKQQPEFVVPADVKLKSKQIVSILGGSEEDYYEKISIMKGFSVEDILEAIMELNDQQTPTTERVVAVEKKVEVKEEPKSVIPKEDSNNKKIMVVSEKAKQLAKQVFAILGGSDETQYYEICDALNFMTS